MKKIYGLVMAILLMASCTSNTSVLDGEIYGLDCDTVLVFARDMAKGKFLFTDTVPVVQGRFSVEYPDSIIYNLQIVEKPQGNMALRMPRNMGIIIFPGEEVKVKGVIGDWVTSGSELYDKLNSVASVAKCEREYRQVEDKLFELFSATERDEQAIDSVKAILKTKAAVVNEAKLDYIVSNPGSLASAYYVLAMKAEDGLKACRLLKPEIRNGLMKEMIDRVEDGYRNFMVREESKKDIKAGKPAPDFSLKNLKNEMMTLASFKGKYVLLDFWGIWCGWCIKGMPRMKAYYAKYRHKIEFVGINCRDTEEKWRKGVAQYQLPWVNLYNGNSVDIVNKYAVPGFPTKVLIDPDGIILEVFVGESDAMYDALDRLFK